MKKRDDLNEKRSERRARRAYTLFASLVAALTLTLTPALAASGDDPLTVVNNLSEFIFSLIRAVGLILLGFGVLQLGLSLKSHDPSQRERYAHHRRRHRDYVYQGNSDPHHRVRW